jgi:hypothetical protein
MLAPHLTGLNLCINGEAAPPHRFRALAAQTAHAPFGEQVVRASFGEQLAHAPFGEQIGHASFGDRLPKVQN